MQLIDMKIIYSLELSLEELDMLRTLIKILQRQHDKHIQQGNRTFLPSGVTTDSIQRIISSLDSIR